MIAAIITLLAIVLDLPCHCARIVATDHGYRCAIVRARDVCPVDLDGWHVVNGATFCSRDCGPDDARDP